MFLVTGGAGFIGRKVVESLSNDSEVLSLDINQSPYPLENCRALELGTLKLDSLVDVFCNSSPETIIHMGMISLSGSAIKNPDEARRSIVDGTKNVLAAMKASQAKRIIFISTSMVYGDFDNKEVTEQTTCSPIDPYGKYKLEAESLVQEFSALNNFEWIIVRPTAVYGVGDKNERVLQKFIRAALEGKKLIIKGRDTALDFTHVDEVAGAITSLAKSDISGEIFNIARGKPRTLLEVVKILETQIPNLKYEVLESDVSLPKRGLMKTSKARDSFAFNPLIDIETGIPPMIEQEKTK